jgi:hypothetical protein
MKWYFVLLPIVQSYLFGCYYDYSQPLVLPEQLPVNVCTHVLLIGATFVKDLNVGIVQQPFDGSKGLQSMRDYRTRDSNKLKVVPSIVGDDVEWKRAMNNSESQMKFITSLIEFAKSEVINKFFFCLILKSNLNRISMVLILIGNILVVIINHSIRNLLFDFVSRSIN